MKVYGYISDSEDFVELREVSIDCTMEELDKFINFLSHTREQHSRVAGKTEMCHSHYRDWDKEWIKEDADIIIINMFK